SNTFQTRSKAFVRTASKNTATHSGEYIYSFQISRPLVKRYPNRPLHLLIKAVTFGLRRTVTSRDQAGVSHTYISPKDEHGEASAPTRPRQGCIYGTGSQYSTTSNWPNLPKSQGQHQ
ncbi:unnamed protein product, partial [Sphacelaria rigidula]